MMEIDAANAAHEQTEVKEVEPEKHPEYNDGFLLTWDDPAAPQALYTYALQARRHGMSDERFAELMKLVDIWEERHGM